MSLYLVLKVVLAAGAIGGVVNAIVNDDGLIWPRIERVNKVRILRPGFIGNVFIGAVAAAVSWGLYGPSAATNLFGPQLVFSLTPSTFAGSILVGMAGAKWLTNEADKQMLRAAVCEAARGQSSPQTAEQMRIATPAEALSIIKQQSKAQAPHRESLPPLQ